MKICEKCGAECLDDAKFCSTCGDILDQGKSKFCRKCGRELVNDYEREHGVCVNCESPSKPYAPPKYLKRLRVFEVLYYICGVIGALLLVPSLGIASFIVLIPCIGIGAVIGALREILKRIG